jgi:hypothetical protein
MSTCLRSGCVAGLVAGLLLAVPAVAQNNQVNPGTNWGSSWGFSTSQEETLRLLQADTIKKAEEGYYDTVGQTPNVTVNTTNNYDQRSGVVEVTAGEGSTIDVVNHTGDDIGQNTNVIGAINNSSTTIDIQGSNNTVTAVNSADSTGCQDGSVNIGTTSSGGQQVGSGAATGGSAGIAFSSGASSCN